MSHKFARFSELRAENVESNLFQYHLRHVIKKGLVEKAPEGYCLAPQGLFFADRYSSALKDVREQPKIVTIICIRNSNGHKFLRKKQRQPWLGDYHFPAGKIHIGEDIQEAAKREAYEKTSFVMDNLEHKTTAHVRIFRKGELVNDYYAFLFAGYHDGPITGGLWYHEGMSLPLAPGVQELIDLEEQGDKQLHSVVVEA